MGVTLFDQVRRLELPPNGYAIFGSGPLAIRDIIPECNDLDILCGPETWEMVSHLGATEILPAYGVTVVSLYDGSITFGTEWGIGDFNVGELIRTAEMIDSLPFVRLEHVIRYKRLRSSAKDLQHLSAFEASDWFK